MILKHDADWIPQARRDAGSVGAKDNAQVFHLAEGYSNIYNRGVADVVEWLRSRAPSPEVAKALADAIEAARTDAGSKQP